MIILMGKSFSGKTTLSNYITKNSIFNPIVTYTTRPKRKNEIDGIDYRFTDTNDMLKMIEDNKFIEHRIYNVINDTWYYGTLKANYSDNSIIILDVKGAKAFVEYYGKENCDIFYLDVDLDILKERGLKRGDNIDELNRRLEDDEKVFNEKDLKSINVIKIKNDIIENMFDQIKKYL